MTVINGNARVGDAGSDTGEMDQTSRTSQDVPIRQLLSDDVLDLLLERSTDEAGQLRLTGENSMLGQLVKAVLERALEAELTTHLGYGKHEASGNNSGNSRNGRGRAKRCRPGWVRYVYRCRGIGRERSSRCWCPSVLDGSREAWMT